MVGLWLNARMPSTETTTERDLRTSLTLVVDLGRPSVGDVGEYFVALDGLWDWCTVHLLGAPPPPPASDVQTLAAATMAAQADLSEATGHLLEAAALRAKLNEVHARLRRLRDEAQGLGREEPRQPRQRVRVRTQRQGVGLVIESMRLASPLEVVLTAATSTYAPIAYSIAAMALFERAVRLLMEWQKHRLDIRERGAAPDQELSVREATTLLEDTITEQGGAPSTLTATVGGVASLQRMAPRRIVSVQREGSD
jgi:hypothetical protein